MPIVPKNRHAPIVAPIPVSAAKPPIVEAVETRALLVRPRLRQRPSVPAGPVSNSSEVANSATSVAVVTNTGATAKARDYEVGYKKPPRHSQFKPGQSGNAKGRPRGAKSVSTLVRTYMTAKVAVRVDGKTQKMRRIDALVHRMIEDAFSGKTRDRQLILGYFEQSLADDKAKSHVDRAPGTADQLDLHDEAILAAFRDMISEEARS